MHIESLPTDQQLISQPSLYRSLDMSRAGLEKLRKNDPSFPRPIKFGESRQSCAYYIVGEVKSWLEAKMSQRGAA